MSTDLDYKAIAEYLVSATLYQNAHLYMDFTQATRLGEIQKELFHTLSPEEQEWTHSFTEKIAELAGAKMVRVK